MGLSINADGLAKLTKLVIKFVAAGREKNMQTVARSQCFRHLFEITNLKYPEVSALVDAALTRDEPVVVAAKKNLWRVSRSRLPFGDGDPPVGFAVLGRASGSEVPYEVST